MKNFITVLMTLLILYFSCGKNPSPSRTNGGNNDSLQYDVEMAFPNLTFTRPVDLQPPGDGSTRLFVVEQSGRIIVFVDSAQVTNSNVFLDIQNRVNDTGNEEGLLGLAFHPDYKNNGYFYVNYTANPSRRTVIARYQVNPTSPTQADDNSELILLEFSQPYENHNGGQLAFGPDGYLYIATGDGGSGGDPQGNGQNQATLLGKILRIDVDHPSNGKNYGIPADNPFPDTTLYKPEIFAYGLRNPWRFSFDSVTGGLWAGDVGQNRIEEVDIVNKGKNYGWNIMEGSSCYNPSSGCNTAGLELPIWEYDHSQGIAITGGYVYRGAKFPGLYGTYIFSDFGSGRIWQLKYNGVNPTENRELIASNLNISSFGVNRDREIYICSFDGKIYRLKIK
jgi:glucose/arabinose dehydrogenase